jgi:hypothetical protein
MYKLTLVPLFALSLVFAIPQPVPDQINELGKRNDRGHIFTGQVRTFHSRSVHDADPSARRQQFSFLTLDLVMMVPVKNTPSLFPKTISMI